MYMKEDQISVVEMFFKCKEWITYLFSHWKTIVFIGIVGASFGLLFSYMNKPVYTATLTFVLEDEKGSGNLSGALGLASQFGFDLGNKAGGIFVGSNLIELFKSRTMVEKTLLRPVTVDGKTLSFAQMYIRNAEWEKRWRNNGRLKVIDFSSDVDRNKFSREQDSIMGVIYSDLSTNSLNIEQKDKKLDILSIEMKSGNEYFAKYFVETLAKEVSEFYILTKNKRARSNLEVLERQTDSIRAELNNSIMGVAASMDNTYSLNPALNIHRVPSTRRQVDVQANSAILTELVKQTELAKVTLRKETPLIQVVDYPILPLKKEKIGKLKGIVIFGLCASIITIIILSISGGLKKYLKKSY